MITTYSLTFCATVNVILHVGATPVLADVGPDGNIDPASVDRDITENTRAIIPVHFAGLPVEMDAIWDIARRHRLYVIIVRTRWAPRIAGGRSAPETQMGNYSYVRHSVSTPRRI